MELTVTLDRRAFLAQAMHLGSIVLAGLLPFQVGCSRSETTCYDPELFSTPERSLRDSKGYVDRSPHGDTKQCSGCQFFRTGDPDSCGSCQILGGPVHARGHCDAWAARTSG